MNPLAAVKQARDMVDLLLAEGYDADTDVFVQEVILPTLGTIPTDPPEIDPPILTFDPLEWTLVNGTYGTVDNRGRTALAVGEGDPIPSAWTTFTSPIDLDAASDWTLVVQSTGEINANESAVILEETGGGGMDMRVTQSFGLDEGDIRSATVWAPNTMAFSPTITTYVIVHEAGTTTIQIYGSIVTSGAGVAASGAGEVTLIIPPEVAIFGLWIYDFAWEL